MRSEVSDCDALLNYVINGALGHHRDSTADLFTVLEGLTK